MEAMHSLRKGQGTMFAYGQSNPDAVIINRVFETAWTRWHTVPIRR
ncbi:transposase and inactivated derivatives [Corynebacterium glutamicum]|nr:transposase and inactivated derivatives [Corynebacterium glutamicum]BAV24276.1 transposase and inactivated derivatives [Corynebacterium glutamicum]